MVEKWSATIFIEKNNTKQKSKKLRNTQEIKNIKKYIRIEMDFAIFYDLLLLNTLKQVHTPKIRRKILLISIYALKSNLMIKFA